jgi:cytidylate kinase
MTLIAMSASYGAGGSRIAPDVAERLGVPFVDRAIPMQVAERLDVPLAEVTAHDEQQGARSWLERVLSGFAAADPSGPAPLPGEMVQPDDFQRVTEQVLLEQANTGRGVILGRGSVIVLREDPRVLRVRLDGPRERRLAQAMRLQGLDREAAERGSRVDRVHLDYARQFYGADIRDPALYHLVLDSTSLSFETCAELIVTAARALSGTSGR